LSYWESQDDNPTNLHGGGAFLVKRFTGWFSFAAKEKNKLPWLMTGQS